MTNFEKYLTGSHLIRKHFPDFRTPVDIDWIVFDPGHSSWQLPSAPDPCSGRKNGPRNSHPSVTIGMNEDPPSLTISRLRAQVEELRQQLFFQGNPQVLSDLELQGVLAGRELQKEEPEIVITDEQRDRVRAEIQKRIAARPKVSVPREPTMRELLQKRLTAVESVNGILQMHFGDLCREVGVPVPQNPDNFSPRSIVQAARGTKDERYIREWAWDSELRFGCDKMRDALGVEQFGPFYDSDNHDWRMIAIGGNTTSQRVLDIIARSYQPSPTACIRAAMTAFNETGK